MIIKTKIFVEQLPKEVQKYVKPETKDGTVVGAFTFVGITNDNLAYFELSATKFIKISLVKLVAFTHQLHRWICNVETGKISEKGNPIYELCEVTFWFEIE